MPLDTPVALIVFNRPEPTRRVLEAIAAARPSRLFVIADGPRPSQPEDVHRCAATRAIVERLTWPCEVRYNFSDTNLGCKGRVATGLEWLFAQADAAIILEDDCLPTQDFFAFCEAMLARYHDHEQVQMVRGVTLVPPERIRYSYYFSRFYNIWGWATWARAWQHFDVSMRLWEELRQTDWLERYLPTDVMARQMRHFFDETHAGRIDAWDYQWVLSGWLRGALAVTPAHNLVTNIGFGSTATHERDLRSPLATLATASLDRPIRHPPKVEVSETADFLEWERVYSDPGRRRRPWGGLKQRLWRLLR